jgi:hypothetical protein
MIALLMDGQDAQSVEGRAVGDDLWLRSDTLETQTGWAQRPEGLCQGAMCVPIPAGQASQWTRNDAVNLAALWRHLGRPVAHAGNGSAWVFGAGAQERSERLRGLEAPDFELPDLAGHRHRLSDYRGRRVFLVTWASW